MFTSTAYADDPASASSTGAEPSALISMAPLLLIFVVFYFLLIRPQQKKIREHDDMIKALRRGDKIITGGGIHGIIHKIEDDALVVEIAADTRIRVTRDSISHVLSKPVAGDNDNKTDDDKSK